MPFRDGVRKLTTNIPQHFPPPGHFSRTIPEDISHLPEVLKLNLKFVLKLGVLVRYRVRVWVSVVIRKCAPLFNYLANNSLNNVTSI